MASEIVIPMTSDSPISRIATLRVVPIVVLDEASAATSLADALVEGGLACAEVTLRTPAAIDAIALLAGRGDILVGAGTVLTADQVERAVDAGAQFIISPGLGWDVVNRARELGIAVIPGVSTASEVQAAVREGLDALKLFPAEVIGGVSLIDALAGPFANVAFMPSGGITLANAGSYLERASVFSVGASWIASRSLIATGDFGTIRQHAQDAAAALGTRAIA
jgi:2-dehydro-3-deoxyphosphogluconate aldolase/(4S)-4-hydroxy-2-oxoglutarate aldolase